MSTPDGHSRLDEAIAELTRQVEEQRQAYGRIAQSLSQIHLGRSKWVAEIRQATEERLRKMEVALTCNPDTSAAMHGTHTSVHWRLEDCEERLDRHKEASEAQEERIDTLCAAQETCAHGKRSDR